MQQQIDDVIDLRELIAVLWRGKWVIVSCALLFAAVSLTVALSLPNQYRATAVLSPSTGGSGGGLSSQLSGLASLAGVTLGGGGEDESQIAMEVMKSWGFIEQYIAMRHMEVAVFAVTGWNPDTDKLIIDSDIYDSKAEKWIRRPPKNKSVAPTSWELYERFADMMTVDQDKKTGLINVSVEYYSPALAKQWVDGLVMAINEYMRDRKLGMSNKNIEYLQSQIDKTPIAEMKTVFYQLIESEIKNKMLAEASPEYQFVTVSRAMVPERKTGPKRVLIVVLSTLVGGVLAAVAVLLRRAYWSGQAGHGK